MPNLLGDVVVHARGGSGSLSLHWVSFVSSRTAFNCPTAGTVSRSSSYSCSSSCIVCSGNALRGCRRPPRRRDSSRLSRGHSIRRSSSSTVKGEYIDQSGCFSQICGGREGWKDSRPRRDRHHGGTLTWAPQPSIYSSSVSDLIDCCHDAKCRRDQLVVEDQRIGRTPRAVRAGCQGGRKARGQETDKAWPSLLGM